MESEKALEGAVAAVTAFVRRLLPLQRGDRPFKEVTGGGKTSWCPRGPFGRSLCASTVHRRPPPEGCTHIDEVLSAAPPDVEGPPCRRILPSPRWRMPPQVETWTRLALEPRMDPNVRVSIV